MTRTFIYQSSAAHALNHEEHPLPLIQTALRQTYVQIKPEEHNEEDASSEYEHVLCLSDSSPVISKQPYDPSVMDQQLSAMLLAQPECDTLDILPTIDKAEFAFFEKTLSTFPGA